MDFILYIIFIFTLLLIIISVNEYFESCKIQNCIKDYALVKDAKTEVLSCVKCEVANAESYFDNTCNPNKCIGKFTPDGNKCSACSVVNALDYANDGSCNVIKCSPGYTPSPDNKACNLCPNFDNVFTYDEQCKIKQCYPGYTPTGTEQTATCKACDNGTIGVDNKTRTKIGDYEYISAYDKLSETDKSNVPPRTKTTG